MIYELLRERDRRGAAAIEASGDRAELDRVARSTARAPYGGAIFGPGGSPRASLYGQTRKTRAATAHTLIRSHIFGLSSSGYVLSRELSVISPSFRRNLCAANRYYALVRRERELLV